MGTFRLRTAETRLCRAMQKARFGTVSGEIRGEIGQWSKQHLRMPCLMGCSKDRFRWAGWSVPSLTDDLIQGLTVYWSRLPCKKAKDSLLMHVEHCSICSLGGRQDGTAAPSISPELKYQTHACTVVLAD